MFRIIGILVLCLCVVAGVGYYFNWFSFSTSNNDGKKADLHLTFNKDKAQDDIHRLQGEKTIKGDIHQTEAAKQEFTILDSQNQDVTIKVASTTKIKIDDKDGAFADLKAGDPVVVKYEANKDGNSARTITVSKKS